MTWFAKSPALLAVLGALAGASGCGGRGAGEAKAHAAAAAAPRVVKVRVTPLETKSVERTIEAVGTLKGWEDVVVGAKRGGRVVKVFHDMGDRVKPGEPLVELEAVDADLATLQAERRLQVELAKLGLKQVPKGEFDVTAVPSVLQAKVTLDKSKQNLARERSLIQRNAGAMQDFQNAENDERGAEAGLANAVMTVQSTLASAQAAQVALDVARQTRKDLEIRAPVPSLLPEGTSAASIRYAVVKRSVAEGQMLKEGDAVVQLVIEQPLRLWTNVAERHAPVVKNGQTVRVDVASFPGKTFDGKVARINPSVDAASRTFQVEVLVPNPGEALRPGGFAKASIVTDRHSRAKVVPIESVVKFAGVTKVFYIDGDKARSVNVETGLEGAGWAEVIGDLPADAQIVTDGYTQLAEGTPVEIRQAEPETGSKTAPAPVPSGPTSTPTPG